MRTWLNEVTASLWGRAARARLEGDAWKLLSWDQHPVTQRHISRRVNAYWLDFVHRRFVPGGTDYGLSLACGSGVVERYAVRVGMCRAMDACDISAEALAVAGEMARQEGLAERIRYFVADLNADTLERNKYGICFSSAAIHHVADLEHAFAEIRAALRLRKPSARGRSSSSSGARSTSSIAPTTAEPSSSSRSRTSSGTSWQRNHATAPSSS